MSYEWLNTDNREVEYHTNQYKDAKQYTKELLRLFDEWKLAIDTKSIVDFGCGGGAVTNLFAQKYPGIKFLGLDINPLYISLSNEHKKKNSKFQVFDLYS